MRKIEFTKYTTDHNPTDKWISICSMHFDYNKDCKICDAGNWMATCHCGELVDYENPVSVTLQSCKTHTGVDIKIKNKDDKR